MWSDCKIYRDVLQQNKRFIGGELPESPYHETPIEDPQLVPKLLEMHDKGILTVDGQAGVVVGDNEQYQRSWTCAFVPFPYDWKRTEKLLSEDSRVDYMVIDMNKGQESLLAYSVENRNLTYLIDEEDGTKELFTNFPPREGCNEELDFIGEYWFQSPSVEKILREGHYLFVSIAMKEYAVPGVEDIVLSYFS